MQHSNVELHTAEIVRLIAGGRMALPQFQRPFVWNPNAVLELVDSLVHGWPIGTFLLLSGPQPFALRGIKGGPDLESEESPSSRVEYFILDGQQRITSLYHVFTDTGDTQYFVDLGDDLHEEMSPFSWRKRSHAPLKDMTILLAHALDPNLFEFALQGMDSEERRVAKANRSSRLGYLIDNKLTIPAILLHSEIDLEALTRIFETLNRTGTPLDAFDLMVALLYPEGFHLGDEFKRAKRSHPVIAELDTPGLEILKLIALWQRDRERSDPDYMRPPEKRVRGVRQRDALNTPPGFVVENWPTAVDAYAGALNWVRDAAGVGDSDSIPSRAMLLTIAYALRRGVSQQALSHWYWTSVGLQSYAQGANTQVTTDVDRLSIASFEAGPWLESLRASLSDEARRNRVLRMGLRGLAVKLQMRDILDGKLLTGPVRDVSVTELAVGAVASPAVQPLVDRVFLADRNIAPLRRLAATEPSLMFSLNEAALRSQGVVPNEVTGGDIELFRSRRTEFFTQVARGVL